ncbi:MAG: zinc ribbon domain-containing protein [Clostridia bacterium]|nr:zinc ribbon domain-containing protein [Clostridia bacterium]
MKYCVGCGKELVDEAVVCTQCGRSVPSLKEPTEKDSGGFLWGLLGFFIPMAGLILYLVWKDTLPKRAKAVGKGALVSTILGIVFFILYLVFFFSVFFYAMSQSM